MSLILASKSASRQAMLRDAGVDFRAEPAHIDERGLEAQMAGAPPSAIAAALAEAKALAVAAGDELVLGSDSLVVVEGRRFDKPMDRIEAQAHLNFFSGRMMELHSAAALARRGDLVWSVADIVRLRVRSMSVAFVEEYLAEEWPAVAGCVGVFRIEARGVHLFESIEGSHFTVLGMPLLPVLAALRALGELPS
jgi:septum formation protein